MKRLHLVAATLSIGVMSGAHAQSSVTLYGIVDAGVQYTSNSTTAAKYAFLSGGNYSDRCGIKGTEDLGDGLAAIFTLENGFNIGSGAFATAGTEFNRQAFVGLANKRYGTLTFGRQYSVTTDLIESYGPASISGLGAFPGDISDMDNGVRLNNAIKFKTVSFNGFTADAMYGFSNNPGQMNGGAAWAAGFNYVQGPIVAGATYYKTVTATGAAASSSAAIATANSVSAGFGRSASQQVVNAVAGMQMAQLYTGLDFGYTQYRPSDSGYTTHSVAFTSIGLVSQYQFRPDIALGLSYSYTFGQSTDSASKSSAPHYQQIAGKFVYSLSKRTALYVFGGYQHASGQTLNGSGSIVNATANLGDGGNGMPSNGQNQAIVRIGMYNKF